MVSELVLLKEVSLGGVPSNPFPLSGSGPICLSPYEFFLSKGDYKQKKKVVKWNADVEGGVESF
jgi:hypothetical protein